MERFDRLNDPLGGVETDYFDLDDEDFLAATKRKGRQNFHRILEQYATAPANDDDLGMNAFFARDEFELDQVDTDILLPVLRYERNSELEQFSDEVTNRLREPASPSYS